MNDDNENKHRQHDDAVADDRPAQFAKVPAPLIRYLKPGQLNVWAALKLHDWGKTSGVVWPSQRRLAQETGQSERTIRDVTKQLHDMGVLVRRPRGHSGFEYHLADIAASWTPATPARVAGDPAGVAPLTSKSCRSNRQELPVLPAEAAAEVEEGTRSRETDHTEEDPHEEETPACGGDDPPKVGPAGTGGPKAGSRGRNGSGPVPSDMLTPPELTLEEEILANDPAFLDFIEAKRAERPDGSWYPGGWSYRFAMDRYRSEVNAASRTAEQVSVLTGGLDGRLASHRKPSHASPEERRARHKESLAERLAKHR